MNLKNLMLPGRRQKIRSSTDLESTKKAYRTPIIGLRLSQAIFFITVLTKIIGSIFSF